MVATAQRMDRVGSELITSLQTIVRLIFHLQIIIAFNISFMTFHDIQISETTKSHDIVI